MLRKARHGVIGAKAGQESVQILKLWPLTLKLVFLEVQKIETPGLSSQSCSKETLKSWVCDRHHHRNPGMLGQ